MGPSGFIGGLSRIYAGYFSWLVVLTILKNISQWERLSHSPYIPWKKNTFETTNQLVLFLINQ